MSGFDRFTRRCIAYPFAVAGVALASVSEVLIQFAAWVLDIDLERNE
jgi:hypothetical protein